MKQILSLFITSLALCTACTSPKGSDTVQVAETTTEQTIQKASSAIHYNAFSHNDYWRERPLLDALSFRFNCVEADLWLIDGELYVSHDRPEPNPAITFENLYLKPLVARIQANGGKVYPDSDRPFYLMVDCKAQGEEMYKLLKKQMEPYKEYFCSVDNGEYKEGAVLFFLSGDRPKSSLPKENSRFTFLDGQIKDLGQGIPASLAPVISDNYSDFFTWKAKVRCPPTNYRRCVRSSGKSTMRENYSVGGAPRIPSSSNASSSKKA